MATTTGGGDIKVNEGDADCPSGNDPEICLLIKANDA